MDYYSLANIKMMIVDDDVDLCNSIKFFFEDHNSVVLPAHDGEAGIRLFVQEKPDIVLVDLNMPKLSGHNLISSISRLSPETPIIVISGTGVIKEAIRSMNLGAWDFVTKPIHHFEELELSVLRALEKSFLMKENKNYKENLENMVKLRTDQLKKKSDDLEKLVEELRVAKEKAESSDRIKTEFLAQISHEIRTPVNNIVSYVSLLKDELEDKLSDDMQSCFTSVNKGCKRLINTIEKILNISELAANSYKPMPKIIKLDELVYDLLYEFKLAANEKNLKLLYTHPENKVIIQSDEYSVKQVIANLIDNAIKYTREGEISITIEERDKIYLEIADTGIGISKEYLSKLFTPFSQEDSGYTRRYEGTGLGLSLVKKYCELNNIDIDVASVKGKGTRFTLAFNH